MTDMPEIGKISPEIFKELIFPRLGAKRGEVRVGPQHGVDTGIAEIGNKAVSFTCDPVFIVPEYGWERAAWFAIHIIASDSVTSGLKPAYLSIDLNLPMDITKEQITTVWETMHRECEHLGIAVITGHTARYENCAYPMVGGATIIGVGELNEYVAPEFARVGDRIIITKGPAIEAVGIFAAMFPDRIIREFGADFNRRAQTVFEKMTVVEDALTCGIWGGLYEIAQAAGLGVRVEQERIVVEDCIPEICEHFGIDPYASISEGTLIITCREHKAAAVITKLAAKNIKASIVGELTPPEDGMVLVKDGVAGELKHPIVDPFWRAFYDALAENPEVA